MTPAFWIRIGALSGLIAVAAGAFGAHSLRGRVTDRMLEVFQTGVTYQMAHALALVLLGVFMTTGRQGPMADLAGWGFLVGTALFSGSLYALTLTGVTKLGLVTPVGGLAFLMGWAALAVAASPRS